MIYEEMALFVIKTWLRNVTQNKIEQLKIFKILTFEMNKREQTQRFNGIIIDVNKNNDMIAKYYELPKIKILLHNEEFLVINKP